MHCICAFTCEGARAQTVALAGGDKKTPNVHICIHRMGNLPPVTRSKAPAGALARTLLDWSLYSSGALGANYNSPEQCQQPHLLAFIDCLLIY